MVDDLAIHPEEARLLQYAGASSNEDQAAVIDQPVAHQFHRRQMQQRWLLGRLRRFRAGSRIGEHPLAHLLYRDQIQHADESFGLPARGGLHAHLCDVQQPMQRAALGVDVFDALILDLPHVSEDQPFANYQAARAKSVAKSPLMPQGAYEHRANNGKNDRRAEPSVVVALAEYQDRDERQDQLLHRARQREQPG